MANEWIHISTKACYNSTTPGFALSQNGVLLIGKLYAIEFTISEITTGKLVLDSLEGKPEYTMNGTYQAIGIATSVNLTFIGGSSLGNTFNGCIDSINSRLIPLIKIKDLDDNIIFQQTNQTGVTANGNNIQYQVDWTGIDEGCYRILITDGVIDYLSDCIDLKLTHDCSLLLSWTNDNDAFGFNYSTFNLLLRVKGRLWHPNYPKEKNVFKDNGGIRTILKSQTNKEELLTVSEMPEYLHDALAIGLEHDWFYIDGIKYTNEETEYTPKWRKSSQLASSEAIVIKDKLLLNNNC